MTVFSSGPSKVIMSPRGPRGPAGPSGERPIYATWAALAAVAGSTGASAEVPTSDAATHTDPVAGGTVNNSGIFNWSDSPAGWQRVADTDAASAKPYADAAAASLATLLSAPVAAALPPTQSITINGQQPALVIDGYDATGLAQTFMAFMPDGKLVSASIAAFVTNMLGNAKMTFAEVPGWLFVVDAIGTDGLSYVLAGVRSDGTLYPSSTSYAYSPGAALATADMPAYSVTGYNGFISYGQSLSMGEGTHGQPAVSTTPSAYDLTFGSGLRSAKPGNTASAVNTSPGTTTAIALVERDATSVTDSSDGFATGGETPCSGAAASASRFAAQQNGIDPSAFVKFCSAAGHGSYGINQLNKASGWYANFLDHVSEAKARATAAGKGYVLHRVLWMQGENDAGSGMARATYLAALKQLRTDISTDALAITGQSAPVHMLTYQTASNPAGTLSQLNQIQLAQFDAVNQDAHIHFVAPTYFMLRRSDDGTHPTAIEYRWYGEYVGRADKQLVIDGRKPDCVWPISATANGNTVKIKFRVPQRPLLLETVLLNLTQDYGFVIKDDTGTLTLSNIQIVGGDTVQITINRTLGANPKARYALDNLASGLVLTAGASGNLRDSTTDSFTFGGVTYRLPHWSPHFEIPVLAVEF